MDKVIVGIIASLITAVMTFVLVKLLDRLRRKDAETEAKNILDKANQEATTKLREADLEAKEKALAHKTEVEKEISVLRDEIRERERANDKRQELLEQQSADLKKQERHVEQTQRRLSEKVNEANEKQEELKEVLRVQQNKLHEVSGMDRQQATDLLLERLDQELKREAGALIQKHERTLQEKCDTQAREMLMVTMQRYAASHTSEATTSSVDIPNDEMKGRIIGREGRNIRALEKATGVDVIIDDTPGVVIVSAFDPVRREIARIALSKLIADGRIHPSRIEELVAETEKEVEAAILKYGEEAMQEADVFGLHKKVVELLGRLRYRTSYSQNVLRHSIEVCFIAGMLAEELGMDGDLARRAGLLHDIGKAADHDQEGGHPKIGADLLKRFGEGPEVVHAALGHHDDIRPDMPYTVLVAAADACSASRPGARRETLDRYIKRMQELETIATGFSGVEQAFAIQAGREVRVIASANDTTDETAAKICRDIANAFEQQLTYPGEIKVTLIRETRVTEMAR